MQNAPGQSRRSGEMTRNAGASFWQPFHWREYLAEAAGLGLFMLAASCAASLLEGPESFLRAAIDNADVRRALMGLAMWVTAVVIIYSPLGTRSGAHLNPATTLTFWMLGKIHVRDVAWYIVAQTTGGLTGMLLASQLLGAPLADPAVYFVATLPGYFGETGAFFAEAVISFVMMITVLACSNHRTLHRFTGMVAGGLLAAFIYLEAPISGTSLNPARTFASAVVADDWRGFWIYLIAQPLGMLMAGVTFMLIRSRAAVHCAKLSHPARIDCIFRCTFHDMDNTQSDRACIQAKKREGIE